MIAERDWQRNVIRVRDSMLHEKWREVSMEALYQQFKSRMEREEYERKTAEAERLDAIDWREDGA